MAFLEVFNKLNIYMLLRDFNKIRPKIERAMVSILQLQAPLTRFYKNLEYSISKIHTEQIS